MNFMISFLGWFLWNWAEFSITKEKGDGYDQLKTLSKVVSDDATISTECKKSLLDKIGEILKRPITLREYASTHYETWVGSFATIFLLLWIGYRKLSIAPFAPLFGLEAQSTFQEFYVIAAGAAWDAFIFGFKLIKNYFGKKEKELKD